MLEFDEGTKSCGMWDLNLQTRTLEPLPQGALEQGG